MIAIPIPTSPTMSSNNSLKIGSCLTNIRVTHHNYCHHFHNPTTTTIAYVSSSFVEHCCHPPHYPCHYRCYCLHTIIMPPPLQVPLPFPSCTTTFAIVPHFLHSYFQACMIISLLLEIKSTTSFTQIINDQDNNFIHQISHKERYDSKISLL